MLTEKQRAGLVGRLEEERERLQGVIAGLEREVQVLGDFEATERASLSNHQADGGSEVFEQEQTLTLERNEQAILLLVDEALARSRRGEYGNCARCGQPIPFERLEALPHAAYCITCQAVVEAEQASGRA